MLHLSVTVHCTACLLGRLRIATSAPTNSAVQSKPHFAAPGALATAMSIAAPQGSSASFAAVASSPRLAAEAEQQPKPAAHTVCRGSSNRLCAAAPHWGLLLDSQHTHHPFVEKLPVSLQDLLATLQQLPAVGLPSTTQQQHVIGEVATALQLPAV